MSSLTRTIQRAYKRGRFYNKRGSMLGIKNPKDKCLIARKRREDAKKAIVSFATING